MDKGRSRVEVGAARVIFTAPRKQLPLAANQNIGELAM